MLQKELAKRLKSRYDAKMDGNGWLEVSSDRTHTSMTLPRAC